MAQLKLSHTLHDFLYIIAGAFISGFALQSFLVPNEFLDGGVTGVSLLLHETYHWNIALVIIVANIPFIIAGAVQINMHFAYRTIAGTILLALFVGFVPYPPLLHYDKVLVATFGGLFLGLGIGLGMRGGCALDGIEVLALYTLKRSSLTISEIILGLNVILFLIAAVQLRLDTALYAILTYYIVTKTIGYVIEGVEEYTGVTIISGKSDLIKETLVKDLGRGITVYKGERGFMKDSFEISQDCDIVFTVITRFEVRRLRNAVSNVDPKAFVFTHTIKETAGGILKRHAKH